VLLPPPVLLVAAHILVTIILNVPALYLRLASVIIPLPFGLMIFAREKSQNARRSRDRRCYRVSCDPQHANGNRAERQRANHAWTMDRMARSDRICSEHRACDARLVQDLLRTAVPLIGIVLTAAGSLYTGLKGILAWRGLLGMVRVLIKRLTETFAAQASIEMLDECVSCRPFG